ncbi:MAG: hypothetical protein JKX71_12935 [Amylibacter sp.]|nr:hypothetical protein [Amylibacter sp.]
MTALLKDRNTPTSLGDKRNGAVAAGVKIYAGAMLVRNAAGYILPATTTLNQVGVGRAEAQVDNTAGADGAVNVDFLPGNFRYANSAAGDLITIADIGSIAWAVDDQTVAKTNGTNTRSRAGVIDNVDPQGVWVRFDEALTAAAV